MGKETQHQLAISTALLANHVLVAAGVRFASDLIHSETSLFVPLLLIGTWLVAGMGTALLMRASSFSAQLRPLIFSPAYATIVTAPYLVPSNYMAGLSGCFTVVGIPILIAETLFFSILFAIGIAFVRFFGEKSREAY